MLMESLGKLQVGKVQRVGTENEVTPPLIALPLMTRGSEAGAVTRMVRSRRASSRNRLRKAGD